MWDAKWRRYRDCAVVENTASITGTSSIGWYKPGAFENYRYRDELFPTSRFRMAWDALREVAPQRANKRYLELFELAAKQGEALVDDALRQSS